MECSILHQVLAFDEDNNLLYVADRDNDRVQILSLPTGNSSSSSSSSSNDVPTSPKGVSASAASPSAIIVTWNVPDSDENDPKITGYKIESRIGNDSYKTIVADTKNTVTSYLHKGLDEGETYRYKIYAINSEGTSSASSSVSAKPGRYKYPSRTHGNTNFKESGSTIMVPTIRHIQSINHRISD